MDSRSSTTEKWPGWNRATARVATTSPEQPRRSSAPRSGRAQASDHDEVARVAYSLWEQRGCTHGRDMDDWVEAERIVRGRVAAR